MAPGWRIQSHPGLGIRSRRRVRYPSSPKGWSLRLRALGEYTPARAGVFPQAKHAPEAPLRHGLPWPNALLIPRLVFKNSLTKVRRPVIICRRCANVRRLKPHEETA